MTSTSLPGLRRRAAGYALAAITAGVGWWWAATLARADAAALAFVPLCLSIALAVSYGGRGPGLLAVAISAYAIDFLIADPGTLFTVSTRASAVALVLHLLGWSLICWRVERIRQAVHRDGVRLDESARAAAHADRLAQLFDALGQARTPRAVIEAAVQESMYALKADAAVLFTIKPDGQGAEVTRAIAHPAEVHSEVTVGGGPMADVLARGAPMFFESREAWEAEYPAGAVSEPAEPGATALVPLPIAGRVAAVLRLDFREPRVIPAADRDYLALLGTRGGQALDRALQLEFAERARSDAESLRASADQELIERRAMERALRTSETRYRALAARTTRLHALTAALSEAVTVEAVAHAVVHCGLPVAGATAGEVALLVDDGSALETIYAESGNERGPEERRQPLSDGLCASDAIRDGQPVFVGAFADMQERFWKSAAIAAGGGYESSATMPLLVDGEPIGVLAFHFTVPVNFDAEYQALLMAVARHCAQALDRSRLYESTQRARAEAEEANRSKDDFVSTVSHELRSPLNAILGWVATLQSGALDSEKSARALQSIRDNATRQAKLIGELLDCSRMVSGRTVLEMDVVDVRDLVRGVVESMIPAASARGIHLDLSPVPVVRVAGDVRRLEQVFFNLIDNALKFTPQQGRIAIDVRVRSERVEVRVSDNGIGIDADFLPHVFDRFRQADRAASRGGLGLGLAIAKQLIDAHGGTIVVDSAGAGHGATFTVSLPVRSGDAAALPARVEWAGAPPPMALLGEPDDGPARAPSATSPP